MQTVLSTAPELYPVSVAEAKTHMRIPLSFTTDDAYIQLLIYAAIDHAEQFTGRRLLTQTWKAYLDGWPVNDFIRLPFGNLQSITSVVYTDSDAADNTWSSDDYITDTTSEPGRVVLGYGESYPSFTEYPSNPICITFVCGWTDADSVPDAFKHAIKLIVADLYESRETRVFNVRETKLNTVEALLTPHKVYGVYP